MLDPVEVWGWSIHECFAEGILFREDWRSNDAVRFSDMVGEGEDIGWKKKKE